MIFKNKLKIGLALGGGGPKGLAHIGVIKVLEEHNIPIDYIAGSSAGAIAGSFYSAKKDVKGIEDYILNKNLFELLSIFLDPSFKQGILRGNKLRVFLEKYLGNTSFKDLQIPFTAVATDLMSGEPCLFNKGDVIHGVMSSCGMPFLFSPVQYENQLLVDGGLYSPVPTEVVRKMGADIVIGVNLYAHKMSVDVGNNPSLTTVARRAIDIMIYRLTEYDSTYADVMIGPHLEHMSWLDVLKREKRENSIQSGELAMKEAIPKLKRIILQKQNQMLFSRIKHKIYHSFNIIKGFFSK